MLMIILRICNVLIVNGICVGQNPYLGQADFIPASSAGKVWEPTYGLLEQNEAHNNNTPFPGITGEG